MDYTGRKGRGMDTIRHYSMLIGRDWFDTDDPLPRRRPVRTRIRRGVSQ